MSLEELERLLEVQEQDTAIDRLRHRRATLPERAELERATVRLQEYEQQRAALQAQRDVVFADEKRLDDEARGVAAHAEDVDKRLYSGTVTSPRELQAMQSDVEMLRRRLSEIEDEELAVMEQREDLDGELATLQASIDALEREAQGFREVIASAEAEIDAELASVSAVRAGLAEPLPPALVADYEKRRAQNKGAGAARLVGTTCQACHLTIPSTEAERIRRAAGNEVAYCDNCSAILVP